MICYFVTVPETMLALVAVFEGQAAVVEEQELQNCIYFGNLLRHLPVALRPWNSYYTPYWKTTFAGHFCDLETRRFPQECEQNSMTCSDSSWVWPGLPVSGRVWQGLAGFCCVCGCQRSSNFLEKEHTFGCLRYDPLMNPPWALKKGRISEAALHLVEIQQC